MVCVCVCVCVREREREKERRAVSGNMRAGPLSFALARQRIMAKLVLSLFEKCSRMA